MGHRPNRKNRSWRAAALAALLAIAPASLATAEMEGPRRPLTRETPHYPFHALSRGVEGWVVIEYTVNERGSVVSPRVVEADPPGVFDGAAMKALSRWRYEPRNAEPTKMKVKLTFRR